jgi:cytochrome c5
MTHLKSRRLRMTDPVKLLAVPLMMLLGAGMANAADAPAATVTAAGISLHSVSADLPIGDVTFPGGAAADVMANNCTACHSAGMVLTQPALSRADWEGEVAKMRSIYKAPVATEDVPAIVAYLAALNPGP